MGPFSFIPFMECYHGVVNISHSIQGELFYQDEIIHFNDGYGYIEKDWGTSFPESWIWMQCNHFKSKDVSFMFSIAKIPWLGTFFNGFISFLRIGENHYTFATYANSKIEYLSCKENLMSICLVNNKYKVKIKADISTKVGQLIAPKIGSMNRKIKESINSKISLLLTDKNNNQIFCDTGYHAGTELAGPFEKLFVSNKL